MKQKETYFRENCDICSNRFNCNLVKEFDEGKKVPLDKCKLFDDVYSDKER